MSELELALEWKGCIQVQGQYIRYYDNGKFQRMLKHYNYVHLKNLFAQNGHSLVTK
jgi:hypothetical protein